MSIKFNVLSCTTATGNYILTIKQSTWHKVITETGAAVEHYSFDPWGRRRNPADWSYNNVPTAYQFDRGYTGHSLPRLCGEMLDAFGLINMNVPIKRGQGQVYLSHAEHKAHRGEASTDGRVYDPLMARFLSPDNYVQLPDNTQGFNRYSYCLNNPLIYTDPSGELIWLIPNISWSRSGGLSIGLTFMVGIPGIASAQVSGGYSFNSNDFNASIGATAAFNTVDVSYSTRSGFSVGWSAGLSPQMGFPISTNFTSVGVNYNITHDSWSGNVSAFQRDKKGWTFNPSIGVSYDIIEPTKNLIKGQGFRSNREVFDRIIRGPYTCDEIINYFGVSGSYQPNSDVSGSGGTDPVTGDIGYTDMAFYDDDGYDNFLFPAMHEEFHRNDIIAKKVNQTDLQWRSKSEYRANLYSYRNQWRYRRNNATFRKNVIAYALQIPVKPDFHRCDFVYWIPRKF